MGPISLLFSIELGGEGPILGPWWLKRLRLPATPRPEGLKAPDGLDARSKLARPALSARLFDCGLELYTRRPWLVKARQASARTTPRMVDEEERRRNLQAQEDFVQPTKKDEDNKSD